MVIQWLPIAAKTFNLYFKIYTFKTLNLKVKSNL